MIDKNQETLEIQREEPGGGLSPRSDSPKIRKQKYIIIILSSVAITLGLALLLYSYTFTSITAILSNPENYIGKTVKVRGEISLTGYSKFLKPGERWFFTVSESDDPGLNKNAELFVITTRYPPPKEYGDFRGKITVSGVVGRYHVDGFNVDNKVGILEHP